MDARKSVVALLLGALSGAPAAQSLLPPTTSDRNETFGGRGAPGSVAPILDMQIDRGISLPKGVEEQREFAVEPPPPPPMPAEKPAALPRKPEAKR